MKPSRKRTRLAALVAAISTLAIGVLTLTGVTEPATADVDSGTAVGRNCHEFVAFPDVPYETAREELRVPDEYTVQPDDFGPDTVQLFVTVRRCERLEVGGKTDTNVIDSYIAVPICEPGVEADGTQAGCTGRPAGQPAPNESGFKLADPTCPTTCEPVPVSFTKLENYLVQWVTNSHLRATWLKQGAGLDSEVTVIESENLVFDYTPGGVSANFTAKVPAPATSPFTIKATVTEPGGLAWYAGQNQWWDTGGRTLIIFAEAPVSYFGPAVAGTITADDPNSPLGRTFGDRQDLGCERRGCVLTGADADKGILVDPFEMGFYETGYWTKCVRNGNHAPCARPVGSAP